MAAKDAAMDTSTSYTGSESTRPDAKEKEGTAKASPRRSSGSSSPKEVAEKVREPKDLSGKTNYTKEFNVPSMLTRRSSSELTTPVKTNGDAKAANGPAKSPSIPRTPGSATPKTPGTPRTSVSLKDPLGQELARLENEIGSRDVELAKNAEEIRGLKLSHIAKDKAAAKFIEENEQLKERVMQLEKQLEGKALELKKTFDEKTAAVSSKNAAELTLRRIYASQKDPTLPQLEQIIAPLEAEIKLKNKEIDKLLENAKATERMLKVKETALVDADKKVDDMKEEFANVETLRNENQALSKELGTKEEEVTLLAKQTRDKSAEIAKLTDQIEALKESLTKAGETTNLLLEARNSFTKLQKEYQLLELELARSRVSVNRVAVAAASEWKEDSDKVIPVKQWVEERKYLQGEMKQMQDKLEQALKATRSEAQKKDRIQQRLRVIEDGLKVSPQGRALIRRLSAGPSGLTPSTHSPAPSSPRTSVTENGAPATEAAPSEDGAALSESADGEQEMVAGVFYDMLQKEVVQLRKAKADQEQVLLDKEDAIEMLTKRCETLSHAAEVESKKTKRELAALEKEVVALKADISSKEKEAKEREELLKKDVFRLKSKLHGLQQGGT